jgi:putative holliday junction resolvase
MPDPANIGPCDQNIVIGFDFGQVRIGVAVGNRITASANPLCIVSGASNDIKFKRIEALFKEWKPSTAVVGRPLYPDGNPHEMTLRCERFARQLQGRFGVPVTMTDERYSSAVTNDDAQAAAEILQQYLQS